MCHKERDEKVSLFALATRGRTYRRNQLQHLQREDGHRSHLPPVAIISHDFEVWNEFQMHAGRTGNAVFLLPRRRSRWTLGRVPALKSEDTLIFPWCEFFV